MCINARNAYIPHSLYLHRHTNTHTHTLRLKKQTQKLLRATKADRKMNTDDLGCPAGQKFNKLSGLSLEQTLI